MVDFEDRYSTEKASSVQLTILYDCDAEALSVEVLLDTPPGSPKNCPEAKGGYVRVQISQSRPVSVFMMKPSANFGSHNNSPFGIRIVETEDWPNINLVVESRAVKFDREISKNEVVEELINIRMGVEKYSGLIAGQKLTGKTEIRPNGPRSSRWLDLRDQDVVSTI
ncbi:hypothetical protein F2Q70_00039169 [Brassica cretica]|uniref:Uncharacterized protein n=1 Tax=Brassica cretica TaxID=69181 RepID=A0A8S9KE22_BRACR|nr:hypothetical protein F2Q70_00039169 [Brassica cretica]